ncbi:MAG: class I SAM-dependent methyltransferase [Planctomycetota bacterium]|jgi:SAM-dependent methyltransferase
MPIEPDYRSRIYDKYASRFQDAPEQFDSAAADHWGRAYESYLKGWLPKQKDTAILEVGCGGGKLLHFLKIRKYSNFTGIDISPEQILLAQQVTNRVVQADAIEFLKDINNKYDLIIGLDIIEHLYKYEVVDFLTNCHKALKPDGRIILQTPNAQSPFAPSILYGDFTHEICFTPNGLQHVLNFCDFHNFHVRETGPAVHGCASAIRYVFWRMIRLVLKLWNLIETGDCTDAVLTRTFLISAHKK